jgi:hypothetical protein
MRSRLKLQIPLILTLLLGGSCSDSQNNAVSTLPPVVEIDSAPVTAVAEDFPLINTIVVSDALPVRQDFRGNFVPDPRTATVGDPVSEGRFAQFEIKLTRKKDDVTPVTLSYRTKDSTARATLGDYTVTSGTITFQPGVDTPNDGFSGDTPQTPDSPAIQKFIVRVPTLTDDVEFESQEEFFLELRDAVPAPDTRILRNLGKAKIRNVEPGVSPDELQLSINDVTVTEPAQPGAVAKARFTVSLNQDPGTQPVIVRAQTSDQGSDTATAGADYTPNSQLITFLGTQSRTFEVDVLGDSLSESTETFTVTLSTPIGAGILDGTGVGTIIDSDGEVEISIDDPAPVAEGDVGTANFIEFTVSLSAQSAQQIRVNVATSTDAPATASADDFVAKSDVLVFQPGETSKTFRVNLRGDRTVEPDETFVVNLSSPVNAVIAPGLAGQGLGTIRNDDGGGPGGVPLISIANARVLEGDTGTSPVQIQVSLDQASASPVTVNFNTVTRAGDVAIGGQASPADYQPISGTLTFNPGETTKTITVNALGDNVSEGSEGGDEPFSESFSVVLQNPSNAAFAGSATELVGKVAILDDDIQLLEYVVVPPTQLPINNSAVVRVRPNFAPVGGDLVVDVTLGGGVQGSIFPNQLIFPAGSTATREFEITANAPGQVNLTLARSSNTTATNYPVDRIENRVFPIQFTGVAPNPLRLTPANFGNTDVIRLGQPDGTQLFVGIAPAAAPRGGSLVLEVVSTEPALIPLSCPTDLIRGCVQVGATVNPDTGLLESGRLLLTFPRNSQSGRSFGIAKAVGGAVPLSSVIIVRRSPLTRAENFPDTVSLTVNQAVTVDEPLTPGVLTLEPANVLFPAGSGTGASQTVTLTPNVAPLVFPLLTISRQLQPGVLLEVEDPGDPDFSISVPSDPAFQPPLFPANVLRIPAGSTAPVSFTVTRNLASTQAGGGAIRIRGVDTEPGGFFDFPANYGNVNLSVSVTIERQQTR